MDRRAWNDDAVHSADGMQIQFDHGTIWQRDLGPPPPSRQLDHHKSIRMNLAPTSAFWPVRARQERTRQRTLLNAARCTRIRRAFFLAGRTIGGLLRGVLSQPVRRPTIVVGLAGRLLDTKGSV
jgi:hypothetical protein